MRTSNVLASLIVVAVGCGKAKESPPAPAVKAEDPTKAAAATPPAAAPPTAAVAPPAAAPSAAPAASCKGRSIEARSSTMRRHEIEQYDVRIHCDGGTPMIVNAGVEKRLATDAWTALWAAVDASAWRTLPAECAGSGLVDDMGNMWTLTIVDGPDRVQHACSVGDDTAPEATLGALDKAIAAAAAR